jgi:hypothetical protein
VSYPGPGLIDLRLDLDRHARPSDVGAIEDVIHPVDHSLLEPCLYFLGPGLLALYDDLVVGAGYVRLTLFGARQLLLLFCYQPIQIGYLFLVVFP